jgi:hypothetical protein
MAAKVPGVVVWLEMEPRIGQDVLVAVLHRVGSREQGMTITVEAGRTPRTVAMAAGDMKEVRIVADAMASWMDNMARVKDIKRDLFGIETPPVIVECSQCHLPRTAGTPHNCFDALKEEVVRLRLELAAKAWDQDDQREK